MRHIPDLVFLAAWVLVIIIATAKAAVFTWGLIS